MKKSFYILPVLLLALLLGACNNSEPEKENTDEVTVIGGVSKEEPMVVDEEKGEITLYGEVNGKYFDTPTRHAVIYNDGNFGGKSVFSAYTKPVDFYDALNKIGAKAGNNMTKENGAETHVEGDPLDVKILVGDKTYDINDTIIDSNGKTIDMRFGGNKDAALEYDTGCLLCLDSCPVGIVSNHEYTYGAVEETGEVEFFGNKDVLKEDKTPVAIKIRVK